MPITVLLTEDDDAFRYTAERHFAAAGFQVIAERDTMGALARADSGAAIDCLVTDIHMPSGVPHGISLANMLSARNPKLVVIFVTAYEDIAEAVRGTWGPEAVFSKPVDLGALTAAIESRVRAAKASPSP